jgi:hypothetical protein
LISVPFRVLLLTSSFECILNWWSRKERWGRDDGEDDFVALLTAWLTASMTDSLYRQSSSSKSRVEREKQVNWSATQWKGIKVEETVHRFLSQSKESPNTKTSDEEDFTKSLLDWFKKNGTNRVICSLGKGRETLQLRNSRRHETHTHMNDVVMID